VLLDECACFCELLQAFVATGFKVFAKEGVGNAQRRIVAAEFTVQGVWDANANTLDDVVLVNR
jgi:hypothetical protein